MKQITALILFYRHYCIASVVVTIGCCLLYAQEQNITQQVATKLFASSVTVFLISALQQHKLYYYYNMHISRRLLFAGYFIADLIIFSTCLWLTTLLLP